MKKYLLIPAQLTLLLACNLPVYAAQFSNMFSFGDSLSDIGNAPYVRNSAHGAPMSNGDNLWTRDLANQLGINLQASSQGGTDYAYVGDETGPNAFNLPKGNGTLGQIEQFLAQHPQADSKGLYTYWAGSDDFIDNETRLKQALVNSILANNYTQLTTDINTIVNNGVSNTVLGLNKLHNAGARYFMLLNLPNFGKLPLILDPSSHDYYGPRLSQDISAGFTLASVEYNNLLHQRLNNLPYDVVQVDVFSAMSAVAENPAKYGFTNTTLSLCNRPNGNSGNSNYCQSYKPGADPNSFLFWDYIHPTNAGHQLIMDLVYSYIMGPTYASLLSTAPISNFNTLNNNIVNLLTTLRNDGDAVEKQWRLFTSGSYTANDTSLDYNNLNNNYTNDNKSLTIGSYYRYDPQLSFGAAFSPNSSSTDLDQYSFGFDEYLFSLFGEYRPGQAFIDSLVSFGVIDFKNIQRQITLGQSVDVTTPAGADGTHYGAAVNAGYNLFENEQFSTGPIASLAYQQVNVEGYNESGATPGTNLNYFDQTNQTLTSGLGWQIVHKTPYQYGTLLLTANAQYNTQYLNNDYDMRFETASLAGSHGAIPVSGSPTGDYVSVGAGITNIFKNAISLSFNVNTNVGNSAFAQQIYSLTASIPF